MNRRNQSGYDPVGDTRTGRPPLADERDRLNQGLPEQMSPEDRREGSFPSEGDAGDGMGQDESVGIGKRVSEASSGAAKAILSAGEAVSEKLGAASTVAMERGSALAATASERAHSIATELESFTRRQPLGALAGALVVGIMIGLLGRGRS